MIETQTFYITLGNNSYKVHSIRISISFFKLGSHYDV